MKPILKKDTLTPVNKLILENNFETFRIECDLSKRAFAEILGMDEGNYGKTEKGEINLSVNRIKRLRSAFPNINPYWVAYNDGSKYIAIADQESDMPRLDFFAGSALQGLCSNAKYIQNENEMLAIVKQAAKMAKMLVRELNPVKKVKSITVYSDKEIKKAAVESLKSRKQHDKIKAEKMFAKDFEDLKKLEREANNP